MLSDCRHISIIHAANICLICVLNGSEFFFLAQNGLIVANDLDLHLIRVLLRHLGIECSLCSLLISLFFLFLCNIGFFICKLYLFLILLFIHFLLFIEDNFSREGIQKANEAAYLKREVA